MATVAVPVQDPRGMGTMQRFQSLKASLEGAATLVREFGLRKREVEAEPTFTWMLAQSFNDDNADWSRAVIAQGTTILAEFP